MPTALPNFNVLSRVNLQHPDSIQVGCYKHTPNHNNTKLYVNAWSVLQSWDLTSSSLTNRNANVHTFSNNMIYMVQDPTNTDALLIYFDGGTGGEGLYRYTISTGAVSARLTGFTLDLVGSNDTFCVYGNKLWAAVANTGGACIYDPATDTSELLGYGGTAAGWAPGPDAANEILIASRYAPATLLLRHSRTTGQMRILAGKGIAGTADGDALSQAEFLEFENGRTFRVADDLYIIYSGNDWRYWQNGVVGTLPRTTNFDGTAPFLVTTCFNNTRWIRAHYQVLDLLS